MNAIPLRKLAELKRTPYRPTGDIDWVLFGPRFLLACCGGMAVAVGLAFLQSIHLGYIVINAVVAAIALMFLSGWMVRTGHCRNPSIAMSFGLLIGCVAYLGVFHVQLISTGGWQMAHRFDLLPAVIWHNWNTQQFIFQKVGGPFDYQFVGNILAFFFEFVLVIGFSAAGAAQAARRVYSEEARCWANSVSIVLDSGVVDEFEQALETDCLADLLRQLRPLFIETPQQPPPRAVLTLDYFEDEQLPAFLSLAHVATFSVQVVSRMPLTSSEFDAACYLIP